MLEWWSWLYRRCHCIWATRPLTWLRRGRSTIPASRPLTTICRGGRAWSPSCRSIRDHFSPAYICPWVSAQYKSPIVCTSSRMASGFADDRPFSLRCGGSTQIDWELSLGRPFQWPQGKWPKWYKRGSAVRSTKTWMSLLNLFLLKAYYIMITSAFVHFLSNILYPLLSWW